MTHHFDALADFANEFRQPAGPGIEVIETPRCRITLVQDYPIPGPNSVSWIRCRSDDADALIREARGMVAPRHLPIMWILDPGTRPADFSAHLAARDIFPEPHSPEVKVMVLGADAAIAWRPVAGLEIHDALGDDETFRAADAVNAEAFHDSERDPAAQERRRRDQLAAGNRRVLLATVDGERAASAGMTVCPPYGAILNGGAVREKFRGRGIYRDLVAARLRIARGADVPGVAVWGGPMSAPILEKLGFVTVGWRRF